MNPGHSAIVAPLLLFFFASPSAAELFSLVTGGIAAIVASGGYYVGQCYVTECCTERWVQSHYDRLQRQLDEYVYGQHVVSKLLVNALRSHHLKKEPRKALVLSFHGDTGTGKNFVSTLIANATFTKGEHSKFFKFYSATLHFPHSERLATYKDSLRSSIMDSLRACERSIFVFDEVDKIPPQLLDVLRPFLDYHPMLDGVVARRATFIFLSNLGASHITRLVLDHRAAGKPREHLAIADFEASIVRPSYNEGGLQNSALIDDELIDHYIPFLPLERDHIRQCLQAVSKRRGRTIPSEIIEKIISETNFIPKEDPVFARSGCKRLESKLDVLMDWADGDNI